MRHPRSLRRRHRRRRRPSIRPWPATSARPCRPPPRRSSSRIAAPRPTRPSTRSRPTRLALEQGADYVEQDLTLTKDGVLVCLHDDTLERTTDVEARFPDRAVVEPGPDGQPVEALVRERLHARRAEDAGRRLVVRREVRRRADPDLRGGHRAGQGPRRHLPGAEVAGPPQRPRRRRRAGGRRRADEARPASTRRSRAGPAVYLQSFEEKSVRRLGDAAAGGAAHAADRREGRGRAGSRADGLREAKTFATAIGPARAADRRAAGHRRRGATPPASPSCPTRSAPARGADAAARDAARADMRRFLVELPRRRAVHRQPRPVPALTCRAARPAGSPEPA